MYNEVVAPIMNNPKFKLAKKPVYVPAVTEMHQVYVIARMFYLYCKAKVLKESALERISKPEQWAAFHKMDLLRVKSVKNKFKVRLLAGSCSKKRNKAMQ